MSRLMAASTFAFSLLLLSCDKAPLNAPEPEQSAEKETPEKKAADLIKRAEQGDVQAQGTLGNMYRLGEGVPKDAAKAFEWTQKAAEQGDARAQGALGSMYEDGEGIPEDAAKAFEWTKKAAEQGDAKAQSILGMMYFFGDGVPEDAAKFIEWTRKAAEQGDAGAQSMLAGLYYTGAGVPKDASKAFEWYQKAAEQGDVTAQAILGKMYYLGEGVPKYDVKAIEWFQKGASHGNAFAQRTLGVMYYRGEGVPRDNVLAYAWLNLSASQGDDGAVKLRAIVERGISAVEFAEAQRISSAWKSGKVLDREGRSASASAASPATPGKLSKMRVGTLFLVNGNAQAITNHHIVAGCGELRIEGRDGLAKVVTEDAVNDLALVQIPGEAKSSAAITSDPGKLRQGEDIVVFGFPLNAVLSSGGNLTPGLVSALSGLGNNTNQIQITAPIQPGSSGSPVLNKKGEVVGVVSMKLSDSTMAMATGSVGQTVNFAVNGQTLRTFLDTHKVAYRSGGGFFSRDKRTADLADEARKWTLVVECWR